MRDHPTRLGDAILAALSRLPNARELVHYPIWSAWETIVGPGIAQHATPRRLRRGVLTVHVDGPEWMHELHYTKREIRDRLNAHLGTEVVRDIFLVLTTEG